MSFERIADEAIKFVLFRHGEEPSSDAAKKALKSLDKDKVLVAVAAKTIPTFSDDEETDLLNSEVENALLAARLIEGEKVCHPPCEHVYQIIVGNIGRVYEGRVEFEALKNYDLYLERSVSGLGRAGGEHVVLFRDDEPIKEHYPKES